MNEFRMYLTIILTEMCSRVGIKYGDIDFTEPDWYMQYEWTEEEQDNFRDWLADYLYNNNGARKELLKVNRKTKKHCKKSAEAFVFQFGWKFKREVKE